MSYLLHVQLVVIDAYRDNIATIIFFHTSNYVYTVSLQWRTTHQYKLSRVQRTVS